MDVCTAYTSGAYLTQDEANSTLIVKGLAMKNEYKIGKKWKKLEQDAAEDISDVATDVFDYVTKRKNRDLDKPSEEPEVDPYLEELEKRKRARYEALKDKYKD